MIKYSTRGGVSWQIQHLALPHDVFATQPHPLCCILSYSTCNSALTIICYNVHAYDGSDCSFSFIKFLS